jgi:hypothetical protein
MMRRSSLWLSALALINLVACSEDVPEERTVAQCSDGKDNDGDGLTDCGDPDCRALVICLPDARVDAGRDRGKDLLGKDRRLSETTIADRAADGPLSFKEQEPNNGTTKTEFNTITVPTTISGAIGAADDIDLFSWTAAAGDRLVVTVKSVSGGALQPHLAIFGDSTLSVPAAVSAGPKTDEVMAEYYVLKPGTYFIGVRDRRNVGTTSAHVGGPTFGYTVTVLPLSRAPLPATVGGETSGTLDPPGTVAVLSFSAVKDDVLEVTILAHRLATPSNVDSRLSLFFPAQQIYLGTNDDLSVSETDSLLQGTMPFTGTYHAIVENEGQPGADLSFKLKITKK